MFMFTMKHKKSKQNKRLLGRISAAPTLLIAAILTLAVISAPLVRADQYEEQIKALNAQNAVHSTDITQLGAEAASLADAAAKLQAQINDLQAQINSNQAKSEDLRKQIVAAEEELAKQKKLLGENIKAMYLEGDISTIEMLASSKNLNEFVDKQQYRNAVKDKIKTTLDRITVLKLELKTQRETLEKQIADQQSMQAQLDGQRAEQNRLLRLNQQEQAALDQQIKANNNNIRELRRQQLIANARFIGGTPGTGPACGGGYPARWCEIPQDSTIDSWGMYNRECVSYTAFKVAASGRRMPYWGGIGNANQWDDNAREAGTSVDANPREGDVAQTDRGSYGHVMYVEYVYGDGTILISQYNAGLDGRYSEKRISAADLNFIHF